jgi:hypothetical protein
MCDNIGTHPFKHPDVMLGDRSSFSAQAGIKVGLSTAGLIDGKFHIHAENVHGGLPRLRAEEINQAAKEGLNGGHLHIVSPN